MTHYCNEDLTTQKPKTGTVTLDKKEFKKTKLTEHF